MSFEKQLDEAKQRFLDAKEEVIRLRLEIAKEKCPLAVGEQIQIIDGNKEYKGTVESIQASCHKTEFFAPVLGRETGWKVSGHRLKKDGSPSKWTFEVSSFDSHFSQGKWTRNAVGKTHEDLSYLFGIM